MSQVVPQELDSRYLPLLFWSRGGQKHFWHPWMGTAWPKATFPLRTLRLIERLNRVSSRVETQDYVPLPMLGLYKYIRLTVGQNEALELGVPGP